MPPVTEQWSDPKNSIPLTRKCVCHAPCAAASLRHHGVLLTNCKYPFLTHNRVCPSPGAAAPLRHQDVPPAEPADAPGAHAALRRVPHGRVSLWHQHDRCRAGLHRRASRGPCPGTRFTRGCPASALGISRLWRGQEKQNNNSLYRSLRSLCMSPSPEMTCLLCPEVGFRLGFRGSACLLNPIS